MNDDKHKHFFAKDLDMWVTDKHGASGLIFKVKKHLHQEKTPYQTIDVLETVDFGNMMLIDGSIMMTDRDEFLYHEMITQVPVNCHPDPEKVLVIGGGEGGALRDLCKHERVKEAVIVEIDERVIDVSKQFFSNTASSFAHPKVRTMVRDGIGFMEERSEKFDVIITDSTDPYGPGAGLFQSAYYKTVFESLNENGILVAQTESVFYDMKAVIDIYKNLSGIFPFVSLYWAPVPTYPGGGWTFCLCSLNKDLCPLDIVTGKEIIERMDLKYYNTAVHKGAFYLPRFILEGLGPYLTWTPG